jgi:hypothetical protein
MITRFASMYPQRRRLIVPPSASLCISGSQMVLATAAAMALFLIGISKQDEEGTGTSRAEQDRAEED